MRFAIISDIHVGDEAEYKGVVRKLSRHSVPFLTDFVEKMKGEPLDLVVNLGDAINDVEHDVDVANLKMVLNKLDDLTVPVINLVGNHEQWAMNETELEEILGIESLYYSKDINGHHIVALHSEAFLGEDSKIGDEQKEWLVDDLKHTDLPAIVFIHHPLADQDLTGNFWFEGKPSRGLLSNRQEVREILERSGKVIAVFNGHTHWNKMNVHNDIPYFNINSIVENFRNDDTPSGCYALVTIDSKSVSVDIRGTDAQQYQFAFKQ
ncbi:MAG: hypothetical protein JWM46_41 [Candidatus Kaiserbacteria bacterium]|nr:hypothetical protein [Candidatus Kaiserbacteria bacterium]